MTLHSKLRDRIKNREIPYKLVEEIYAFIDAIKLIKDGEVEANGFSAAALMDLSKAFDTMNHDPFIARLHTYGLKGTSLKLLKDYLSNRYRRTKIESKVST